jgi:hypothetical protein
MGFAVFLLYLALTFIRPGEQFPQLREWAVMDVTSGLALAGGAVAVLTGRAPAFRAFQIPVLVALWTWALISVALSPVRTPSSLEVVLGFGKSSCVAFLLVALSIASVGRLRAVAMVLSLLASLVGLQAAIGYESGFGAAPLGTLTPSASPPPDVEELPGPDDVESPRPAPTAIRIRGIGMFGDPNDLAVTLLGVLPICLALRRIGSPFYNVLLVWLPVGLITYSIYLTRSRSGVVALAAVLMLSVRHRIGNVFALVAGGASLMGLLALGFLGGRTLELDQSAMGRIFAWSDGLQMLKSSPIWGIGFGLFTQYHPRVAHNSFVHCAAELGLVGYMLWLALILLTLDDLRYVRGDDVGSRAGLQRWARAVSIAIVGSLVGGLFLSRCYDVTLFILLGLGTGITHMARAEGALPHQRTPAQSLAIIGGFAVASIIAVWLYMRIRS